MAISKSDQENEIKLWLKIILKDENLKDLSVTVLGNSEKGDGYMGDIIFATVNGIIENGYSKKYDLVLKCSKKSEALRKMSPVKEAFLNEIYMYEKILPYFSEFQKEKAVKNPFNSFPKCYGSFTSDNMEVIVFENLKSSGYELFPKKQPLTRKHIELVVSEYGKYHATSVAVQIQQPLIFQKFLDAISDIYDLFIKTSHLETLFGAPIDDSYNILKDYLNEDILQKWKGFKDKVEYIVKDIARNPKCLRVILHGDCWNNNFMYIHSKDNDKHPLKVAFLDWQVSRYASPILDLSYFLFSCISEDDLKQLDDILAIYYKSFVTQLRLLGVKNPETVYPLIQFQEDWKNYCQFGILMASLLMKIVSTDRDEVLDIAQIAESGKDFSHGFAGDIRDKENYKNRIQHLVEYAYINNII